MQRDRAAGTIQRMQQSDVPDLFFQAPGIAAAGKPPEPGTARSKRPAWDRNLEVDELPDHRLGAGDRRYRKVQFPAVFLQQRFIVRSYLIGFNIHTAFY